MASTCSPCRAKTCGKKRQLAFQKLAEEVAKAARHWRLRFVGGIGESALPGSRRTLEPKLVHGSTMTDMRCFATFVLQ